jgi:hypothetical protein
MRLTMEPEKVRCIVCGCSENLPCPGQKTETGMCFWTYTNEFGEGLCSACASKPVEEIERRMYGVVA